MISKALQSIASKFFISKQQSTIPESQAPKYTEPTANELAEACQFGNLAKLAEILDKGGNPNERAPDGSPPLFLAACGGHAECAKLLLDRGALALDFSADGRSAWGAACDAGHVELAWAIRLAETGRDHRAETNNEPLNSSPNKEPKPNSNNVSRAVPGARKNEHGGHKKRTFEKQR